MGISWASSGELLRGARLQKGSWSGSKNTITGLFMNVDGIEYLGLMIVGKAECLRSFRKK